LQTRNQGTQHKREEDYNRKKKKGKAPEAVLNADRVVAPRKKEIQDS
jgi:hypothetical protein